MIGFVVAWLALTGWVIIVVVENIVYYRLHSTEEGKTMFRTAIASVSAMLVSLVCCLLVFRFVFS